MRHLAKVLGGALILGSLGCEDSAQPTHEGKQPLAELDKVDLLFVVDDSMSMAEKQTVLAASIRRVVTELVSPPCFDANGTRLPDAEQPTSGQAACPSGSERLALPVDDLHIGVISSSLGSLGSDVCRSGNSDLNDKAHLLAQTRNGQTLPTYRSLGFLAWDPNGELSPAGESDVESLIADATELVLGVGEQGCGFEMPLEATLRFLADPAPYDEIVMSDTSSDGVPTGLDETLLAQRAAFLRSDSIVSVVMLSDENDCSAMPEHGGFIFGDIVTAGTAACATDPNSACCVSCSEAPPTGCSTAELECSNEPAVQMDVQNTSLRCFDQQRRFGYDFQYPIARYANGLGAEVIDPGALDWAAGEGGIDNPLFVGDRDPEHVIFTTITGVPWQAIVTDPNDPASPVKSVEAMELDGTWTKIVGDGASPPSDPFMREATNPRSGASPFTGEDVASGNSINGGDRSFDQRSADLQFACTFPLVESIPATWCDETIDDPRCGDGIAIAVAAYPGTRQLELARALGPQGVVGSICPPLPTTAPSPSPAPRSYAQPLDEMTFRILSLMPKTAR